MDSGKSKQILPSMETDDDDDRKLSCCCTRLTNRKIIGTFSISLPYSPRPLTCNHILYALTST